ncbi:hypothetical protein HRH25_22865 [Flavisolibacter sp. BT320]|nr:hypothetical protein [Flavisolibacter longurius]
MEEDKKEPFDLTEKASRRKDPEATRLAREAESDDLHEGSGAATTPSPEGDAAGENRVTTSISED